MARPKRAMVLAAGLGTRLRPLTEWAPKPLAWLGDRPQIDHVLGALARAGYEHAVVNLHHLPEAFDDAWAARQPLRVERIVERTLLGTAGGVANAAALLGDGDVLVFNADIVAEVDLDALANAHDVSKAAATLVTVPATAKAPTVGLDEMGRVVRLRSESFGEPALLGDYAGVAIFGEALRRRLPREGCLVGDVLLPWMRAGGRVEGVLHHGDFHDTGSLSDYLAANVAWLQDRRSFVAPSARVATGVTLERSIVGSDAVVEGEGVLREVVVWPGAQVKTPLERAIVAPRGVISVPKD